MRPRSVSSSRSTCPAASQGNAYSRLLLNRPVKRNSKRASRAANVDDSITGDLLLRPERSATSLRSGTGTSGCQGGTAVRWAHDGRPCKQVAAVWIARQSALASARSETPVGDAGARLLLSGDSALAVAFAVVDPLRSYVETRVASNSPSIRRRAWSLRRSGPHGRRSSTRPGSSLRRRRRLAWQPSACCHTRWSHPQRPTSPARRRSRCRQARS